MLFRSGEEDKEEDYEEQTGDHLHEKLVSSPQPLVHNKILSGLAGTLLYHFFCFGI